MRWPIIMLGAGGHARVLVSGFRAQGRRVAGCLAPQPPQAGWPEDVPFLGADDKLRAFSPEDYEIAVGVGATRAASVRRMLFEMVQRSGFRVAGHVHPSAVVDPSAQLGAGAQVMAGAILQAGAIVGENAIINTGALVEHGCRIGAHSHIATGAILAGDVYIGEGAHVGAGATILQGRRIGAGATVGAAACVTRDVEASTVVTGVPARPMPTSEDSAA